MSFNKLFETGFIGSLEIRNKVIMAPMGTNYAGVNGEVTDRMIEYYKARAKGGCGMLIVEITETDTEVDHSRVLAGTATLNSPIHARGMAELVDVIHRYNCKAAIQLSLGGGRQCKYLPGGKKPKSSSPIPCGLFPSVIPEELTINEIRLLVEQYGRAAYYAKVAGFDCIEMHAHGGYLMAQFLSPYMNKRNDSYGGDFKGRTRILLEMVEAIQGNVGKNFPLLIRYSIDEFVEGGRTIEESQKLAKIVEGLGIHGIDISAGCYESAHQIIPTMHQPKATYAKLAKAIRSVVNIPVIVPGRLGDPELAEKILNDGIADFVCLGRPLVADPEWVNKVKSKKENEIRRCISCNCCLEQIFYDKYLHCTLNPMAGREFEFKSGYGKSDGKKKILIVGSGPGGMEAAYACGLRGHDVILCEKEVELGGGQLKMAAISPGKGDINNIKNYYNIVLQKMENVNIHLNIEANKDYIQKIKPDVLIIATGATMFIPSIPGINNKIIKNGFDLLAGKITVGNKVIVMGGGLIGCDITLWLDSLGKDVVQTSRKNQVGYGIELLHQMVLNEHYAEKQIKTMINVSYKEIKDNGLLLEINGKEVFMEVDDIVLATGTRSDNQLYKDIKDTIPETYIIGDAKEPRTMLWGIYEAFNVAVNLIN